MSDKAGVMPGDTGSRPVLREGNACPQVKGLSVRWLPKGRHHHGTQCPVYGGNGALG